MKSLPTRFFRTRRSAVAVILAISLVPLVSLVGIAIDFTFVQQARTQAQFAAQAAATHAIRIAAATYALEVNNGSTTAVATAHAKEAGETEGDLWFNAELGLLNRASVPTYNTVVTDTTDAGATAATAPNFSAQVSYAGIYPPVFQNFFNSLPGTRNRSTTPWNIGGNASATTTFAYAQILMLLDTSNSMLIGARSQDILTMEENSVCVPAALKDSQGNPPYGVTTLDYDQTTSSNYNFAPGDGTWIGFVPGDSPQVANYDSSTATGVEPNSSASPSGSPRYQMNGKCDKNATDTAGPYNPCALACHTNTTTTFTANGKSYPADLYGLARSEGVELRVDVLLSATEQAIRDMNTSEAVAGQLSVGVYQFNADVDSIVRGQTGDSLPEATSNLTGALAAVNNIDYTQHSAETSIPVTIASDCTTYNFTAQPTPIENCAGNTNLVLSMQHLVNGQLPRDPTAQPLTTAGVGQTPTTPLKFMFLITDGMEGETTRDGATDLIGQGYSPDRDGYISAKGDMTYLSDNAAVSDTTGSVTPGTCTAIKKLGYTLYVLYVDYLPVSENQYYKPNGILNKQTNNDFPNAQSFHDIADSEPYIVPGETSQEITQAIENNVPTAKALSQCASSTADFYSASSADDIQTALSQMLKSALASTIRLTN